MIEAYKIDIVKEHVSLPDTTKAITARRLTGLWPRDIGSMPKHMPRSPETEMSLVEEKYHLHKFNDPSGHFDNTNFLVKEDELGLFTQLLLLQTSNVKGMCEKFEREGYEKGFKDGVFEGKYKMSQRKKEEWNAMPWYKRLFNKY